MISVKVAGFMHSNLPLLIHIVHYMKGTKENRVKDWTHLSLLYILGGQLKGSYELCQRSF